jgi:mannose-6-phosphate isomerase
MHMLEATLAWSEVDDHPCWAETADEIASLCLESFIRSEDGALLEYFDGDWKAFESDASNVIEPGHQFEWSWLLLRWGTLRNRQDAVAAASRMLTFGEAHGVDRRRGLAVNELGLDHRVRDDRARLWPQTERLKANCIAAMMSTRESDRDDFLCRSAESIRGILRYTAHPTAGAWWEHIDAGGTALVEPTRASSLYHITCAIEQASRAHATLC